MTTPDKSSDVMVKPCSALSVVVNAQADALAAKVYLLQRNLMRVKLAIRQSVSHRNEGKPDFSTGHHIPTCYLGPFGQRADIALPSSSWLVARFFIPGRRQSIPDAP
ncbi:TPA: hypothetical protein RY299_002036 [Enterobacter cloacae]|nr:hypothetical protein [Enterobacter cloacae]HEB0921410.1 hypothetical protein [Enterobacter cloacae]HEB0926181.1 hypothetical protein [Enterobacter cloacae]HEB0936417.1 hypothetical protein [Enterobacter cloacae]HEB0941391.1 hypothetical protein [Enterobacter cloacae]